MSGARPMQPEGPDRDRQMWAARLRLADESEAARLEAERRRELATIVGGHHVGFYVTDLNAAVAHLRRNGVKVLGEPTLMNEGPSAGLRWLYFVSPWGMTMELVSYPRGMAYEAGTDDILWRPAET